MLLSRAQKAARQEQTTEVSSLVDEPIVIDADELDAARRDPRVKALVERAEAYVERLEREGRSS